jgi:hypothetical protein
MLPNGLPAKCRGVWQTEYVRGYGVLAGELAEFDVLNFLYRVIT